MLKREGIETYHGDSGWHHRPEDVDPLGGRTGAAKAYVQEIPGMDSLATTLAGGLDAFGNFVTIVIVGW